MNNAQIAQNSAVNLVYVQRVRALLATELLLSAMTPAAFAFGSPGYPHTAPMQRPSVHNWSQFAQPDFTAVPTFAAQSVATQSTAAHTTAAVWSGAHNVLSHQASFAPMHALLNAQAQPAAQLNLSSPVANIVLGTGLFGGASNITITVGGEQRTFAPGEHVTAAEYVALQQASGGGVQTLNLNKSAVAVGGTFNLSVVAPTTTRLVVPMGVTALDNLSSTQNVKVNGSIINYGSVYVVSTDNQVTAGSIAGQSIINGRGGTITTDVPSALVSSLLGSAASIVSGIDLTLSAADKFSNSGLIATGGNLNLFSATGNFSNTGTISTSVGNINISSANSGNNSTPINVAAVGGTFSAINGNINISNAVTGDASHSNISLVGGNYYSQQFNINACQGDINANVGDVTGSVNTTAGTAHFSAATQNLVLGNNNISGDPTFANTAVNGGITINGVNNFTDNVAIVANGDVTMGAGAQINAPGKNVTVIAGAKVTGAVPSVTTIPPTTTTTTAPVVTLDATVAGGGNIDFSNGAAVAIKTANTTGDAGNVILVAMASSGGKGGSVLLGTNSIDASAAVNGSTGKSLNGGDVTIIAGATPTTSQATVTVGSINTGGGTIFVAGPDIPGNAFKGGNIAIYTQQPMGSDKSNQITFDNAGNITKGSIQPGNPVNLKAGVTVSGDLVTAGQGGFISAGASAGSITVNAGSDVSLKNVYAFGAGGSGGNELADRKPSNGFAGGAGGAISITSATGNIAVNGTVSSSGGGGGGGSSPLRNSSPITGGGAGGAGANIAINAGGTITVGAVYAANGGAGGAASNFNKKNDQSGAGGGGGGSYGGGGGGGGDFTNPPAGGGGGGGGGIFGGGGGNGTGGNGGNFNSGGTGGGQSGSAGQGGNSGGGALGGAIGLGGKGAPGQKANPFINPGDPGQNVAGGQALTLKANGDIAVNGDIVGGAVSLATQGTGKVTLAGNLTGFGSATITSAKGDITQAAGKAFGTPNLTFVTNGGTVGTSATPLVWNGGGNLSVATDLSGQTNTGAYIKGTGNYTLVKADTNGTVQLDTNGFIKTSNAKIVARVTVLKSGNVIDVTTETQDITTTSGSDTTIRNSGAITINAAGSSAGKGYSFLETTGTGRFDKAAITIDGNISVTGAVSIDAKSSPTSQGSGIFITKTPTITGSSISLSASGAGSIDIGSSGKPLNTVTSTLSIDTNGSAYISNTGSVTLTKSLLGSKTSTTSSTFSLVTVPDAKGNGQIIVGKSGVTVLSNAGAKLTSSIVLNSSESGAGKGGITIEDKGELTATSITLTDGVAGKGTTGFGTVQVPVKVDASVLAINTTGDAFISNANTTNVNLLTSTAGNQFQLITKGSIDALPGFGEVTSKTILFVTGANDNIGVSAANPALINATQPVTMAGGKSVWVSDSATGQIDLNITDVLGKIYNNTGSDTFSFVAPNATAVNSIQAVRSGTIVFLSGGNYSNIAPLTATKAIVLTSTGNTALSIITPISAPDITLTTANGVITQVAPDSVAKLPGGTITASKSLSLNITGAAGNVDLTQAPNKVGTLNDNVAAAGSVAFTESDSTKLGTIVGSGQILKLNYTTSLTNTSSISVNRLTIVPAVAGKNASITLIKDVSSVIPTELTSDGAGSISVATLSGAGDKVLTAAGTGKIDLNGPVTGQQVILTTNGGNIEQSGDAPITAAAFLSVNLNKGGVADLSKAIGTFSNFNDNVTGKGTVAVASYSDITVGTTKGLTQALTVLSAGNIVTPTAIEADTLVMKAAGTVGIGTSGQPVTSNATKVTFVENLQSASVYAKLTSANLVTLNESTGGGLLDVQTAGSILVAGNVSASTINITTAGKGDITTKALLGTPDSVVTLTTVGGNISNSLPSYAITGKSVTLNSTSGMFFGTGATGPQLLHVSTPSLTVTTGGGSRIVDESTAETTLNASTSGNLPFVLTSKGPLNVNDVSTTAGVNTTVGGITITTTKGALNIMPNAKIMALGGNVILQNDDIKTGSIVIGDSATISASSTVAGTGNVTVNIGLKADQFAGSKPANVVEQITGAGKIFYGARGITALAPDNTLKALDRNIIFDTDSTASGTIQLGGGVTITADPPEGVGAVAAIAAAQPVSMPVAIQPVSLPPAASALTPVYAPSSNGYTASASYGAPTNVIVSPSVMAAVEASLGNSQIPTVLVSASNLASYSLQAFRQSASAINPASLPVQDMIDQSVTMRAYSLIDGERVTDEQSQATSEDLVRAKLTTGNALYMPTKKAMTVETPFGTVKIAPQSVVLVMALAHGIGVYDLHDSGKDMVSVSMGDKSINLAPGKHVFVTDRTSAAFAEVNPADNIAYRKISKVVAGKNHTAFAAEFHITSAIGLIKPMRNLLVSADAADKKAAGRVLKTAAIMLALTSGGEAFQLHRNVRSGLLAYK